MTGQEIINRVRTNTLNDDLAPQRWAEQELVDHLNDALEEMHEECGLVIDTTAHEDICQVVIGVDSANITEGTSSATLKIVNDIDYQILEVDYTLSAQDNVAMTACSTQAVSTYCRYLISVDDNEDVFVTKGDSASTDAGAKIPTMPTGHAPIGILLIATDASTTFTSGTTDLSATGITATFESSPTKFLLSDLVVAINRAKLSNGSIYPMAVNTIEFMDYTYPDWENAEFNTPYILVEGIDSGYYTPWPSPLYPDVITLTVQRNPILTFNVNNLENSPETPAQYHKKLFHGIAYRCYSKNDSETEDKDRRKFHYDSWQNDLEMVKRLEIKRHRRNEILRLQAGAS